MDSRENQQKLQSFYHPSGMNYTGTFLHEERYELLKKIGHGGYGAVYKARDHHLHQYVAVKHVMCDIYEPYKMPTEVRIMKALPQHSLLPKYYGIYQKQLLLAHPFDSGCTYVPYNFIIMEWIDGISLSEKFQLHNGGYASIKDTLAITYDLTDALNHLHKNSCVHKDIKPENVLVTAQGKAFLVDFGIARFHHPDQTKDSTTNRHTGTRAYAPPEQIIDGKTSPVSDIYSLGVTMFHMLTGVNLKQYQQNYGLSSYRLTQDYVQGKRLPKELKTLINGMTQPNKEQRPQSIAHVRMLLEWLREQGAW